MQEMGCGWTRDFSCPGDGAEGGSPQFNEVAVDDGSLGFRCCCGEHLREAEEAPAARAEEGAFCVEGARLVGSPFGGAGGRAFFASLSRKIRVSGLSPHSAYHRALSVVPSGRA